jgi:peptidoglycan hydrolase-like protein with peptidoglycan-binding domain
VTGSSIDLLVMPDATKVQQRLAELKFFTDAPNGIWGPHSRRALREFKSANALPKDDAWNEETRERLFSQGAQGAAAAGAAPAAQEAPEGSETRYEPPAGASLNPLNAADAVHVQRRLMELGYFAGPASGLWGQASRGALRDLKVINGLPGDDSWNAEAERLLDTPATIKASESYVGSWANDAADCKAAAAGGAPVRITTRGAKSEGGSCTFGATQKSGKGWRVSAVCTDTKEKWNSKVNLSVSGNELTWVSERGTMNLHRCGG